MVAGIDTLKRLVIAISAILAVAPTASLLSSLVDVPPDFNDMLILCTAVIGSMTFLIVLMLRNWILQYDQRLLVLTVCIGTIGGLWCVWHAYETSNTYIIQIPYRDGEGGITEKSYVRPAEPVGRLADLVEEKYNGDWVQAIIGEDAVAVQSMMNEQARPIRQKIVMLVAVAQFLLLFGFFVGCWKGIDVLRKSGDLVDPDSLDGIQ